MGKIYVELLSGWDFTAESGRKRIGVYYYNKASTKKKRLISCVHINLCTYAKIRV